jgi:rhodanese-related sulfurtransferase
MISLRYRLMRAMRSLSSIARRFHMLPAWKKDTLTDEEKNDIVRMMYEKDKTEFQEVEDISPTSAQSLYTRGEAVFIDVRTPEEQIVSMLPGAVAEQDLADDPSILQGKTAMAYCTIGYRSGLYAEDMSREGIRILNVQGGILGWVFSGGKVYHAGRETRQVHVYEEEWNYLPDGYEPVMF